MASTGVSLSTSHAPAWLTADNGSDIQVGLEILSRKEFFERACLRARAWSGVPPRSSVILRTEPTMDTLVTLLSAWLRHLVAVPLDPKLGQSESAHIFSDALPAGEIVNGEFRPIEGADKPWTYEPDVALLLYTSGTTGLPKGVPVTWSQIEACLSGLEARWKLSADDTIVHALPLFHVHGLVLGFLGALKASAGFHWVPKFEAGSLVSALNAHKGPVFYAVPTMYHRLVESHQTSHEVGLALSRCRLLVSGSAALSVRDHQAIEAISGKRVLERYGMTETLITCALSESKPGWVGQPLPQVEMIRFAEDGQRLGERDHDVIGELALRGPSVFRGYHRQPRANHQAFVEGYFMTGDLAVTDTDGNIRLVGRKSTDLIKSGGYRIGAGEIEAAILDMSPVSEVAVIGAPDDDLGQVIVAFVVLKEKGQLDERQVIEHVTRTLSPHKRPRHVVFVESLPRNAMGKVQKKLLARS